MNTKHARAVHLRAFLLQAARKIALSRRKFICKYICVCCKYICKSRCSENITFVAVFNSHSVTRFAFIINNNNNIFSTPKKGVYNKNEVSYTTN